MLGCVADNTKLRSVYKDIFEFTTIEDGIREMIKYYT